MNDLVFLVDVDNTLLDNDTVKVRLEASMVDIIGSGRTKQFFDIYQAVRVAPFLRPLSAARTQFWCRLCRGAR